MSEQAKAEVIPLDPGFDLLDAYLGLCDAQRHLERIRPDLPGQAVAAAAWAEDLRPEGAPDGPDAVEAAALTVIGAMAPLLARLDPVERARAAAWILRVPAQAGGDGGG